ncbi:MAG: isoprenoid biosynthesis glyoxalase ElbB [Prolixibacteraceae bacterium]|jgi:enhancing lycopene biosynthesis protein 2|nr:isoprenoid biosynthesis glyoxalase ElbB [Prolixibacteraceae bacterium]
MNAKKFAVVLAGCGVYDGAEIQEAVATMLAIDRANGTYQCFAPDENQYHVINHLTGEVKSETRNVLEEAARIARGNVLPLANFEPKDFDALIFPGGFGVAKNLCTFAIDGPNCKLNVDAETAINKAYEHKMPIGALCISPVLIAKVLGKSMLTIGSDEGTANAIESLGAKHKNSEGSDIVIDIENRIITSPCYMHDTTIGVVANGAENVIDALLKMMD